MANWDEIKTAFQVARIGTVSGAAEVLGVHHATVIRHIDALEQHLGTKLFQRHARGYTPTEAGEDLLRVAQATDDQFSQLTGRLRGQGAEVTGELVVTALPGLTGLLTPVLTEFQRQHPDVIIRFLTGARLFRLEYGEAHVAIRAGAPPEEPDNVVQPFYTQDIALYAHKSYLEVYGPVKSDDDLVNHRFVGPDDPKSRAPFYQWLLKQVGAEQITYRVNETEDSFAGVVNGAGLGFLPVTFAQNLPDLVQQLPPRSAWCASSWIVTHVDLHRTAKVQAFLKFLKEQVKTWP